MSADRLRAELEDRTGLTDAAIARAVRAVLFALVGISGVVVDIATVGALASVVGVHYLIANAGAFLAANTWNYNLNRAVTFGSDGGYWREYASYLGFHSLTFALRVGVVAVLVDGIGAAVIAASAVGIGVAAAANFVACEFLIFDFNDGGTP